MSCDDEIVQEFLVEGYENLDRLERELVAFEEHGATNDAVGAIFRTIHTIKGTAGFFGFERLGQVTHVGENLLAKIREGELTLTCDMVSTLLELVDACRGMLGRVAETGTDGTDEHPALCARLTELQSSRVPLEPTLPPPPVQVERSAASDTTVRVDVALLDQLMDLAGELVLARNQLLQLAAANGDPAIVHAAQRVDVITSELQAGVMKTRMQPIGGLWSKLPRVVRDLANELGKRVRLELEGQETGLDRSVLEAIKDPLTHLVRNAVDHGIESPELRAATGKAHEGVVRLRASHMGGHVMVEFTDDGGGIDPARVRSKALERGLITSERAARMSDQELLALVFVPGFSTAQTITNISGRGVGMDVVKANIARIGGTVDIQSQLLVGTTIRIKIPLTLAIIQALIVTSGGERYAIPLAGVLELVRIATDASCVEMIDNAPVYRLRGALLPLVHLDELFEGSRLRAGSTIVVLHNEGRSFGLVVDAVHDTEEIVVKPIGKRLLDLGAYAGATILGDGRIALILDVRGIAIRSCVGPGRASDAPAKGAIDPLSPRRALLVVRLGGTHRAAIALEEVARLETIRASTLERAGGVEVVQYRDRMLPLVRLGSSLGYGTDAIGTSLSVIVCRTGRTDLGLVVDEIVDIVEQEVELERGFPRHGLLGSAVIGGKVTDLVDLATIAERAHLHHGAVS